MPKKSFTVLLPYCLASVASPSSSSLLVETPILAFLSTLNLSFLANLSMYSVSSPKVNSSLNPPQRSCNSLLAIMP